MKRRRLEDNGEKKAREEEVEDGVKQLDEEAEKRRRRLHEWQKKEEAESESKSWMMAPTRELVQQIHTDIKKFGKSLSIRSVAVYGGSGVAQQISELRRGTEIIICTPGRMIDILSTNSGKVTNLQRVTFLVMDEADRMFDMGLEPQITRIIQNIRPDRQTLLFSATFPRQVEALARKVLNKPVEIQAGGRSVANQVREREEA